FLAGGILILMGVFRMGVLLKFVPYPVVVGFTTGIALIIFSSQVPEVLGLEATQIPPDFVGRWLAVFDHFTESDLPTVEIALLSLVIILLGNRLVPVLPGSLPAILMASVVVWWWDLPVQTLEARYGQVPNMLPAPHFPAFDLTELPKLVPAALTIALLGALESLLSAVVADGMIGARHRSNVELIAQGVGNLLSPIFAGMPATGAIARTATNVRCGGRTPVAAIVHALTLLLIILVLAPLAGKIPLATLAAVLILVAWNMAEWESIREIAKSTRSDFAVMLVTFLLTVMVDLIVAFQVGLILAAFLFMQRIEKQSTIGNITSSVRQAEFEHEGLHSSGSLESRYVPAGVEVFELFGPLFYGVVERFKSALFVLETHPRVLILRMRNVSSIDASGLRVLRDLVVRLDRKGCIVMLSGVQPQVLALIKRSEFIAQDRICNNIDHALSVAQAHL
ncbi:MAG: SulP family inorganic anion transporter, partial [Bdellovibrionales bacterium]|nr:SulP family inorganic anion transporter [Bdellovibrionales bacterium]